MSNATVTIETIDPKRANHLLACLMEGQRPTRDGHILRLATEIESGNWHLTSDAILLVKDANGAWRVANGQHRLHAVVLADKACEFLVLKTDDLEVYKVLDAGIGRSTGDALHTLGIEFAKEAASVSALILQYDRGVLTAWGGRGTGSNKITRSHCIDYAEEHYKQLEKELQEVVTLHASKRFLSVTLGAAILHLGNRCGKGDAWAFIRNVYLGGTQDAAHDIRERLIRNASAKMKLHRQYIFALLIKAYRSYVQGTRPGVLKVIEGEEFPKLP